MRSAMKQQTRRSFLAACTATGLAAAMPSVYVHASDKSGTRLPVLGSGAHTYECVHDWLIPPEGLVWGDTHGLCQDEQGNIYVGHTVHKSSMRGEAVVVYDQKGRFIRAFGEGFRGGAHGLKLRREGKAEFLYHCDINRCRVVKTTLTGEEIWVHGYPREDSNYSERPIEFVPTNVAPMVTSTSGMVTVRAIYCAIHWKENFSARSASPGRAMESFRLLMVFGSIHAERRLF